jgi:hypothetical protein
MGGATPTRRLAETEQPANHRARFGPHSQPGEAGFVWRARKGAELGLRGCRSSRSHSFLTTHRSRVPALEAQHAQQQLGAGKKSGAVEERSPGLCCWSIIGAAYPPADIGLSISTVSSANTDLHINRLITDLIKGGSITSYFVPANSCRLTSPIYRGCRLLRKDFPCSIAMPAKLVDGPAYANHGRPAAPVCGPQPAARCCLSETRANGSHPRPVQRPHEEAEMCT